MVYQFISMNNKGCSHDDGLFGLIFFIIYDNHCCNNQELECAFLEDNLQEKHFECLYKVVATHGP